VTRARATERTDLSKRVWLLLIVTSAMGCTPSKDPDQPRGDSTAGALELEVSSTCDLELGLDDEDVSQQFSRVRGAFLLADGRIVVAAAGVRELQYFGPTGEHLHTAGGEGDGPGEFRDLTSVVRLGADTLAVYDRRARRLTVLDEEGALAETYDLREIPSQYRLELLGKAGDRLAYLWRSVVLPVPSQDYYRDTVYVGLLGPAESIVDTVATLPAQEWYYSPPFGPARAEGPPQRAGYRIVFGYDADVSVWNGRIAHGDRSSRTLRLLYPGGAEVRTVSWGDEAPRSLNDPYVSAYIEDRRSYLDPQLLEAQERQLQVLPDGHVIPLYSGMRSFGNELWVRSFPELLDSPEERRHAWTVLAEDGAHRATVRTPPGFELLDASEGFVLGMRRTEFDVPYVSRCEVTGWPDA